MLARGSATVEHGWLGSGSSYFLLAAARCLACPARQPAPAQALPQSLRQRRVLARQSVGLRGHSQRGGRALGRSSGANGARVPPAQRMASLGPTSASPPVSCKKPSFFIGANRPCARLAPARLHASRRARACLQPAAVFISDSAARDLAGLRARCAAVRSRALSLRALSPPVAGAPPHWAGQPWACPQATAMRL